MIPNWFMRSSPRSLKPQKELNGGLPLFNSPDDFLVSEDGVDKLDGICMMLIAIGENLKNLDKVTNAKLLARHPEVDWKGAKGIRDIISHHYFDLNAEVVFSVCKERLPGLVAAVKAMQNELEV